MARTSVTTTRVGPLTEGLLTLQVLGREQLSPSFARITLGGPAASSFHPQGFDQWFRLFLPVEGGALDRVPAKLDTLSYLKFLTVSRSRRPVLRNYTVAAHRAGGHGGPEIDVDFVLHGADDASSGPASRWAAGCTPGDLVAVLDEGTTFPRDPVPADVVLVADETAVPAAAGILASLPADTTGTAVLEVPLEEDRRTLPAPAGVDVRWVTRGPGSTEVPGRAALAGLAALDTPAGALCWVAGEQRLTRDARRHWLAAGLPPEQVSFCGYWRAGRH